MQAGTSIKQTRISCKIRFSLTRSAHPLSRLLTDSVSALSDGRKQHQTASSK
jgi:hypothetical protein